jgi:hypothetical protein
MRLSASKLLCAFGILFLLPQGCTSDAFKEGGQVERKGVNQGALPPASGNTQPQTVQRALYKMIVKSGISELCTGEIELLITDFDMSLNGPLKCMLMGEKNVGDMMSKPTGVEYTDIDDSGLPGKGMVSRQANPKTLQPGLAQFNPPRINTISPVVQNPKEFEGFKLAEGYQVNGINKQGQPYQSQGTLVFSVPNGMAGVSYLATKKRKGETEYKSVVAWNIVATGFKGAPAAEISAWESFTVYYNTSPIAIPFIEIRTKLENLLAPEDKGFMTKIAGLFIRDVVITLEILEELPF